jgi:hypothetical protein
MARFVALNFGALSRWKGFCVPAATLSAAAWFLATTFSASAQQMMPPAPAPAKGPATNAASGLPPDTMGTYGKILAPGDQPAHPIKLKLPLPDVGEIKIPSQDELTMRDKLEQLATFSDADIRSKLEKWPPYGKMSLRDQGMMLMRIQDFRDYRANVAKNKAHEMGLLTLTPDQQAKFEKDYWDSRLQLDHDLAKQFTPIFKAVEQKMRDELYRKYSAVSQGPIAQTPKPPASAPKPPGGNPTPVATNPVISPSANAPVIAPPKPVFSMSTNNPVMPVGQAPK